MACASLAVSAIMTEGRQAKGPQQGMNGNRFEFLELGEDDNAPNRQAGADARASEPLVGRDPIAERGPDGEPLAQVRDVDTRGYRNYLAQAQDETFEPIRDRHRTTPGTLRAVEVFGERGGGAGQFNFPSGLALDRSSVLFVADSYNHRVQRITADGGVSPLGGRGSGHGQFLSPQDVATDSSDGFYVVEQGNNRVQKFAADGVLQLVFGRLGAREGEFRGPTGIAVAPNSGDIYVADTGNGRVQRFDALGGFLGMIAAGQPGAAFNPQALTTDASDNVYIADPFANRVLRYDPLGRLAGQFTSVFHQPRALACEDGLLYVADGGDGPVLDSEAQGRVLVLQMAQNRVLATVERPGRRLGSLTRPGGLAVGWPAADGTGRGDLYVADTMNHRILRFLWE